MRRLSAVLFVLLASSASAQNWSLPARKSTTPVRCRTCQDLPVADPGPPTWQYGWPLAAFTGRYIDSTSTPNVQNLGLRTVRARRIRLNRNANRLYVGLGEAVGVYKLDQFFTTTLVSGMGSAGSLYTGQSLGGRIEPERIAVPHQFFYAECALSEWDYESIDIQETLLDFDGDDRGYLYVGSKFGWGMARENAMPRGHVDKVFQLRPSIEADSVFSLRHGFSYYAVVSQKAASAGKQLIYDVTNPGIPFEYAFRDKTDDKPNDKYGIVAWAKSDSVLALLNTDGHIRIYDYEGFLEDTEPLADYPPPPGRKFADLAIDDDGAVWFTSTHAQQVTSNVLYRAAPVLGVYLVREFDVYGGDFSPVALHAAGGWIAVGGRSALDTLEWAGDMRLFRVTNGVPVPVPDYGFFRKYYDVAPDGHVAPSICQPLHIGLRGLQIVAHGSKTYLMYGTTGLGDVYELASTDTRVATTITLRTEGSGSNVQVIATVKAASVAALPLSGVVSIAKNGQPLTSANVSATSDPLTFTVDVTRTDLTSIATLTASYEGDELFQSSGPATFIHAPLLPAPASFLATATSATSVQLTWENVPGNVDFEVQRKSTGTDWSRVALTKTASFVDTTVTANQVYLYRVHRIVDATIGENSTTELAHTYVFTDDPMSAGTVVKATHINELRNAINTARTLAGLTAFNFTNATLTAGASIRALHATELRTACNEVRTALGHAPLAAATPFSRNDLTILRDALR